MLHAYHLVNSKEDYVLILAKVNLWKPRSYIGMSPSRYYMHKISIDYCVTQPCNYLRLSACGWTVIIPSNTTQAQHIYDTAAIKGGHVMIWKIGSQSSRFQIKWALMWNNQSTGLSYKKKLTDESLREHAIDINQTFHKSLL